MLLLDIAGYVAAQNFPITDVAGTQILRSLPPLIERAKEARWDDVVANARALDRNLRVVEPQWLKRKEDDEEDRRRAVSQSSASRGTSVVSAVDDSANSEHTDTKKTTAPQNGAAESRNNDPPSTSNPSVLRSSSPSGGPGTAASLVNASNTSTLKSASAGGLGKGKLCNNLSSFSNVLCLLRHSNVQGQKIHSTIL